MVDEQTTVTTLRHSKKYRSLILNGLYIEKRQGKFYVDEIHDEVLRNKFSNYAIKVGDEVIQLNGIYCEHMGAVTKYVENNRIKNIQLRNRSDGNSYCEAEAENQTQGIYEINMQASCSTVRRKRKCRNRKLT